MEIKSFSAVTFIFTFSFVIFSASGANILFFHGISSYSHRLAIWPLVEKLAETGHNVTFLSPFEAKHPNVKVNEFVPPGFEELFTDDANTMLDRRLNGVHQSVWTDLFDFGLLYCEMFLSNPETQEWISKQERFDLIIIDILFNDCAYALVHKYKAPFVLLSTTTMYMWHPEMNGHVLETSWIPDLHVHYPQEMSFLQRVSNTLRPLIWHYTRCWWYFPKIEAIIRENSDLKDLPPLCELESETSLFLMNTHFSIEFARSMPPLYVPIGGIHIKENPDQQLSKEITDFIDQGDGGFIYMSFGTYAPITKLPIASQEVFYSVLKSFPNIQFILKWEGERPNELPQNALTSSWIPQQALLAHKGIKGFITHGGILSIQEATYYGVPLIVFPIFAEQDSNAEIIERTGRGIRLEIGQLSYSELHDALKKLLTDSSYKERMQETSRIFKDLPSKPVDTAVWWIEYVLRNRNTSFLKPLGIKQNWYERRLLDVWGFVFIIPTTAVLLFLHLTSSCLRKKIHVSAPKIQNGKVKHS